MTTTYIIAAIVAGIVTVIALGVIAWKTYCSFDELPDLSDDPLRPEWDRKNESNAKLRGDE